MTEFVTIITVVCDSARHARGKVATVGWFDKDDQGHWRLQGGHRGRRWIRQAEKLWPGWSEEERLAQLIAPSMSPVCKLCGASVPRLADAALSQLAAQGVSTVSIKQLSGGRI